MDISEYFCCDNNGTLFHVNSNLIYNIMTLITLPSGTVLANDFALPIIAKTLAEAELDRQIVVKAITPIKDSNVN